MVNMNRSLPIYRLNTMVLLQKKLPRATLVTLTYINNKVEVGEFDIKLPVVVEYAWGTVKFDIVCHVAKTVG